MDADPKIVIIVPCFDEANRLQPDIFLDALEMRSSLHFLFVNDGSRDHTGRVLEDLESMAPRQIRILTLERNLGKGEAVRAGMCLGLASDAFAVGYFDADLATPLSEIHALAAKLEQRNALAVIGSRVQMLGTEINRNPFRHYLGRLFATGASLALRLPIYDTQCGAKLFRNCEIIRNVFHESFESRWVFDLEILQRITDIDEAAMDGYRSIVEHPLEKWHGVAGSRLRAKDFIRAGIDLAKVAANKRRQAKK